MQTHAGIEAYFQHGLRLWSFYCGCLWAEELSIIASEDNIVKVLAMFVSAITVYLRKSSSAERFMIYFLANELASREKHGKHIYYIL